MICRNRFASDLSDMEEERFERRPFVYDPDPSAPTHFDPETGLHLNQIRHYDPTVGRWLSEDAIAHCENHYRHVANRPSA